MNQLAKVLLYQQSEIETRLNDLETVINKARRGPSGLTLDEYKTSEWRKARQQYDFWFKELRQVNGKLNKQRKCTGYENVDGKRKPVYKYKD